MNRKNSIAMENGIKLQDGRIVQGFPKQDTIIENTQDSHTLDTTGVYLSIGNKPSKPQPQEQDERMAEKLFTDNAFLIVANRERILNDSRLLLTLVPVRNGLAYTGAFPTATLGVYVEWWQNTPYSVMFDEEDNTMSLIWFLSGSPLTGSNSCSKVYEDGRTETACVGFFIELWPNFNRILSDYIEPKRLYQAYGLHEAIDILKRETTAEDYAKSLNEFREQAMYNLRKVESTGRGKEH